MSITQHSHVIKLDALVEAYGKNLQVDGHGPVVRVESYVDIVKGAVAYIIYTQDESKKPTVSEPAVASSGVSVPAIGAACVARNVARSGNRVTGTISGRPFNVKDEGQTFRVGFNGQRYTFAWLDCYED
jgi:hypothetical protein